MLDHVAANGLKRYTLNTLTNPGQLRQHLASTRLTRVAISRWELHPGSFEVAAPVFRPGGVAVAALELTVRDLAPTCTWQPAC
jgi:DNA-binding IclR family transcriptional regulator